MFVDGTWVPTIWSSQNVLSCFVAGCTNFISHSTGRELKSVHGGEKTLVTKTHSIDIFVEHNESFFQVVQELFSLMTKPEIGCQNLLYRIRVVLSFPIAERVFKSRYVLPWYQIEILHQMTVI